MSFVPGNHKTICIAFPSEEHYQVCMNDTVKIREYLDATYSQHPELFPEAFKGGYVLHGFVYSKKQEINLRRIKLVENDEAYQIRPSFLMPYMVARTDEVEKGLYFKRWGVPFEALTYGFGQFGENNHPKNEKERGEIRTKYFSKPGRRSKRSSKASIACLVNLTPV